MKIIPIYTDQLTGYNHILFISVFWKISSKKPRKIGISSKKVVAKAYFYELCTVKLSQAAA